MKKTPEPTPAPQPPADATAKRVLVIDDEMGASRSMLRRLAAQRGEDAPVFVAPADLPVTGDGDEAVVREIALALFAKWNISAVAARDGIMSAARSDFEEAVRAGLARGRALGAMDAVCPLCGQPCEARRAGRETP